VQRDRKGLGLIPGRFNMKKLLLTGIAVLFLAPMCAAAVL
jgi:hypothetical protein